MAWGFPVRGQRPVLAPMRRAWRGDRPGPRPGRSGQFLEGLDLAGLVERLTC